MEKVRFGIVGMGIGRAQGNAIEKHPRGEVVALCDIVEEKMVDYARELGKDVRMYTNYDDLCADPEVDAIFVGTGNQLHVPMALKAVEAGKHVLVTKPLSDNAEAAEKLVQAAEAAGVVNMMSLSTRFSGSVQFLGKMARDGGFGKRHTVWTLRVRRSRIPNWGLHFVTKGGGAFRDMGVHVLDSTWWIMGCPQPVRVEGVAGAHFGPRGVGYWDFAPAPPELVKAFEADDFGAGLIR